MVTSAAANDAVSEAVQSLSASIVSHNEEEAAFQGLSMLHKLCSNIVANPTEDKYKRFKQTNAKIAATLLSLQGGINDLIVALGFSANGEFYEFSGDVAALKKGTKALDRVIEPMKVARMSPEDRAKHELLQRQKAEYKAQQAKQREIMAEQKRLQQADRQEKSTEEVVASKANKLNFGANLVQFKPPVSR